LGWKSSGEGAASQSAIVGSITAAARRTASKPGRLYRAIGDGRLIAAPGGGPGKPTLVSLEAVQTFCRSEGLRVPDGSEPIERAERSERSGRSEYAERSMSSAEEALTRQALETMAGQYLAQVMARQSDYFEAFLRDELTHLVNRVVERVVDQVTERLAERFTGPMARSERPERIERSRPAIAAPKASVLERLRAMQAEGLSLQAMANRLNKEAVPTFSGKGRWQKGTIGNLLAQGDKTR
jgi:hypothetical protein